MDEPGYGPRQFSEKQLQAGVIASSQDEALSLIILRKDHA